MKKPTTLTTMTGLKGENEGASPSRLIDARIEALGDWRTF